MSKEKNFFQRNFQTIAKCGIILIPTIYTTLFLGSMWDPYGNADKLPVAIVNEDNSVDYNGKTLSVGDELVDKLKEKKSLDFRFVDGTSAEKGLQDGTYYMVITIPENFSHNASTLLDDNPQKMKLEYATNPGTNYIASKMSESALLRIEKEISSSVTQSYAETLFDQLGTIGNGFTDASDGASQIYDGAVKLSDGNTKITENLSLLADSTLTFEDGAHTLSKGLSEYTDGVAKVNDGAKQLNSGIGSLSSAADSGVGQLNDGSLALKKGISDYTDGVSQALTGSEQLKNGSATFKKGFSQYSSGIAQVSEGAALLNQKSGELSSGAYSVSAGADTLCSATGSLVKGVEQMSDTLSASLSDEKQKQINALQSGIGSLNNGISQLNSAVSAIEIPDVSAFSQGINTAATGIATDTKETAESLAEMQNAMKKLATAHPELLSDSDFGAMQKAVSECAENVTDIGKQLTSFKQTASSVSELSDMGGKLETLKASVSEIESGAKQVLPNASKAVTELENGLLSVQNAIDRTGSQPSEMGVLQAVRTINTGLSELSDGAESLENGVKAYTDGAVSLSTGLAAVNNGSNALIDGIKGLDSGADSLYNGLKQIDSNSSSLNSGAEQLSGGINVLSDSLSKGVAQLVNGSDELYRGTKKLTENNAALTDGMSQLEDGASKIKSGASQLADGSAELGNGILTLENGADKLSSALSDGADSVNSIKADENTYGMFASPVESSETYCTPVESNGNAMAAYMMAVGLWVAGLAFCIILDPNKRKVSGNPVAEWLKQTGELTGLALAQAVLMIVLLQLINGFSPMYTGRAILVACVSSAAFLILEYTVNFYGGVIGDFILLVFMVIQLSGCAGTYPKELSDGFYQNINPYLPFTYTVHGFRSAIASGQDVTKDIVFMAMIIIVFSALLLVGFISRSKKEDTVISDDGVVSIA